MCIRDRRQLEPAAERRESVVERAAQEKAEREERLRQQAEKSRQERERKEREQAEERARREEDERRKKEAEDKQREQLRAAAAAQLAAKGEPGPSSPALSAATDESLSLGQTDSDSGGGDKW